MSFSIGIFGKDNDFSIKNGKFALSTGIGAVRDRIVVILQRLQGEWFLNSEDGIPFYTQILGSNNFETEIRAIIISQLLNDPSVVRVKKLVLLQDVNDYRKYKISSTVVVEVGSETTDIFVEVV